MEVKLTLSREQEKALREHAEKKKRTPAEDLLAVWWGRVQALDSYAEKLAQKGAKFHVHLPKGLDDRERERLVTLAVKEGFGVKAVKAPPKERKPRVKKERKVKEPKATVVSLKEAIRGKPTTKKPAKVGGYRIDLYDVDSVALFKAKEISKAGGRAVKDILRDNGRNLRGALVKS